MSALFAPRSADASTAASGAAEKRQSDRAWLTPLNLHWAALAVLGLVCLYLLVRLGVAWQNASNHNADAFARQTVALKTAQIASRPLEGLDAKLADSNTEAAAFYRERLPTSYSEMITELGSLASKEGVHLSSVQYAQAPVTDASAEHLTEVRMDANLIGEYRPLVQFINHMERDKLFFLISGLTLSGQQGGQVNLRLRVVTYLHGAEWSAAPASHNNAMTPSASFPQTTGSIPAPSSGGAE